MVQRIYNEIADLFETDDDSDFSENDDDDDDFDSNYESDHEPLNKRIRIDGDNSQDYF